MDLPKELLEQYQKGRILVFIGHGINGVEWARLGQELTDRIEAQKVSGTETIEELMELYQSLNGRQALVQFVLDFYHQAAGPGEVHHLLARLNNCRLFVTTCVDERLEGAFGVAGRPLDPIIHRSDLAYSTAYSPRLYRLYGSLKQPESLRLTQEETADALSLWQDEGFSDVLKGHLADSTIVFVGYDLDDAFFKQLYRNSIKPLHRHNPRCYAFAEHDYTELTRWFCQQNNIQVLKASLADTLAAFIQTLEKMGAVQQPGSAETGEHRPVLLRQQPYKRLLSYQPEDAFLFFGRRKESEQLLSLVHANQLVVLYGDSGVGKSSLLGAGLIPMLEAGDYMVLRERILESPSVTLRHRLAEKLNGESSKDASLPDLLSAVTAEGTLVIILDQFEEFFTRLDSAERASFTGELAGIFSQPDLPVKWVLSLRSEYLAHLNELRPFIPDIFKTDFYLAPLDRESTADAISKPLSLIGMGIENELLNNLTADLSSEGDAEPPQLQIVCYELYQVAIAKEDDTLRLADYNEIGGMVEILGSYLEKTLRRLEGLQSAHARQILISLIGTGRSSAALSLEEIAQASRLTREDTALLLTRLQDERLVKIISRESLALYELAHAYLANGLAVAPDVLQRRAMEELLHRGVQDWQHYRILMSQEEMRTLRMWVDRIDLTEESRKLLLRSAIQRNDDLAYWLQKTGDENLQAIMKEYLRGSEAAEPQPEVALAALAQVNHREPYSNNLRDLLMKPSIPFDTRRQAALYLAQTDPTLTLQTLRNSSEPMKKENQAIIIKLYNADAMKQIKLGEAPAWSERFAMWSSRLRSNIGNIFARTAVAGLAAMLGGIIGSLAGIGLIEGDFMFYLFGASFVPAVWAASLTLAVALLVTLRLRLNFVTLLAGAVLGNLPMVILAAIDPNPESARLGLIYGALGALVSGAVLASAFYFKEKVHRRWNSVFAVGLAVLAGLSFSFMLRPLVTTTGIPGFNIWSLAGILSGGAASMMLGLLLVPIPAFSSVEDAGYQKQIKEVWHEFEG